MDFSLTEQQQQLRQTIIAFAKNELNADIIRRDSEAAFPRDLWRKCAELDIWALPFPEAYGGCNLDLLTTVLSVEALSYACRDSGLVHAILTQLVCGIALNLFGNSKQKESYLPAICRGEKIIAQAATEAEAGSDVFSMRTKAIAQDGSYLLNGNKMFISNGPVADIILVLAVTQLERKGFGAHSMLLVEKHYPGFSSGKPLMKMGLRTLQNSELIFEDCCVPQDNLIGKEGQGGIIFNEVMEWERIIFGACHVGTMLRLCEDCTAYAKDRKQFGQAIGKFQAVSSKIARMKMNIELARLMVYKAAVLKDQGSRAALEAATIKVFASESLKNASLDAVQIHGAYGYMTESEVERELRDSIASTIYSGTVELNTLIISKLLGL